MTSIPFPPEIISSLSKARIVGIRSGTEHRYTGVWVVVVDGRVFLRSYNNKPNGWYAACLATPAGQIRVDDVDIDIIGREVRSKNIQAKVTRAYAQKYSTKGSAKWIEGFSEPVREATTLELVPLNASSR